MKTAGTKGQPGSKEMLAFKFIKFRVGIVIREFHCWMMCIETAHEFINREFIRSGCNEDSRKLCSS